METNYTPVKAVRSNTVNPNSLNTALLIIATITAFILALLLFFLIQKKIRQKAFLELEVISYFRISARYDKIIYV